MDGKYGNFGSGTASLHRQRRQTTKAEPLRNLVHCVVLSVLCTQKLQLLYVQYSQISGGGGEGPASHARTPPKCQMPNAKCPALRDRVLPQWRRVEVETRHPALALGVGHWTLHHCVQRTVVALEAAQRTGNSLTLTARQTDSLAKRGFLHGRLPASNLELYQRRTVVNCQTQTGIFEVPRRVEKKGPSSLDSSLFEQLEPSHSRIFNATSTLSRSLIGPCRPPHPPWVSFHRLVIPRPPSRRRRSLVLCPCRLPICPSSL